ncbi:ABC transporter substrate-binding protein [Acidianus infernus]|uniref:ABC transporter substrate-binding protein n=1 Tax=Acidianus infernus TaxID=12915 RepID=A0A6A9QK40_ACIIN|nr:ABC transporter substrate-binding protein [Acidianus infernus]MUM65566.1 ABC transporter substrate-binding protein [Acidianus infernus]
MKRIVTLDPATTEIVSFLDGTSRIVGVPEDADYPEEVKHKVKVTRKLVNIDNSLPSEVIDEIVRRHIKERKPLHEALWDEIYELQPDLIVGQGICEVCALPSITTLGGRVKFSTPKNFRISRMEVYNPYTFMDIPKETMKIAKAIGRERKAEELKEQFEKSIEETKGIAKGTKTVVIEWIKPIHLIGKWVSDMVSLMGSKPLARPGGQGGTFDWEIIREFNPDYLIISPCSFSVSRSLMEIEKITTLPGYSDLNAVKEGHVYVLEPLYARASQRTLEFLNALKEIYTTGEVERKYGIRL